MNLHSPLPRSTLARLLHDWTQVDGEPPRQDVAERLGQWLGAADAVQLDGALQAIEAYPAQARQRGLRTEPLDAPALQAALQRTRTELEEMLTAGASVTAEGPQPLQTGYSLHHQRYLTLQKRMELAVAKLRGQVRQTLSRGPVPLRQLAALDGVLEQVLGAREQKLLTSVPVYLERRHTHWLAAHRQQRAASSPATAPDDPEAWTQPGGWLHSFRQDLRELLLAELQLRLQPVAGLIEAATEAAAQDRPPEQPELREAT